MPSQSKRQPLTAAHLRLGAELRKARKAAAITARTVPGFSPGHVSNVENGHVTPSAGFVEAYIRLFGGGSEIRSLYGQVRQAIELSKRARLNERWHQVTEPGPPQTLADIASQSDVIKHYVTEVHEAHCTFNSFGAVELLRSQVSLRALTPGVVLYYAGSLYDAEKRRGILRAEALDGLSLVAQEETSAGAIRAYFELDRSLNPEDLRPHIASYSIHVNSEKRAMPQLIYYSRPGTVRLAVRATFAADMSPRRLWAFCAPNIVNIEHRPEDVVQPEADTTYSYEFSPTIPDWCYGFSWMW